MDADLRSALDGVQKSIIAGHANLSGKLDLTNQQFTDHLVSDAKAFTALEIGQRNIETKVEGSERRRKEDSEKLLEKQAEDAATAKADKIIEDNKKLQMKIAWIGGILAILAALGASVLGSFLSYSEAKAARQERLEERIQMKVQKP